MYGGLFGKKGERPKKKREGSAAGRASKIGGDRDVRDEDASSLTCSEASDESLKSPFGGAAEGSPKGSACASSGRPPLPRGTLVDAGTQTDLPVERSEPRGVDSSTQTKGTVAKPPLAGKGGATCSSEGDSSDSSSASECPDVNGEVRTSRKKRLQHVENLMRHWKLPGAQQHFCCAYHQALAAVSACVDKMSHARCKPLWCPPAGTLCEVCEAIVEASPSVPDRSCVMCKLGSIGHKTPQGGSSRSSSSGGAANNHSGGVLWDETKKNSTPMSTVAATYLELARHWRLSRAAGACCLFHTHALVAMEVAEQLDKEPCNAEYTPCSGWFCSNCDCNNDDDAQVCEICGEMQEFGMSFTDFSTKRSL